MLLRLDARGPRGAFTEGEESADFVAELGKSAVIRQADFRHRIFVSGARQEVNLAGLA